MPDHAPETGADEFVLFVDDEPALLDGVKINLRKEPYQIVTCTSGSAALELLAEQPVDVIVSDERMPGMSGSELLAQVRHALVSSRPCARRDADQRQAKPWKRPSAPSTRARSTAS